MGLTGVKRSADGRAGITYDYILADILCKIQNKHHYSFHNKVNLHYE